MASGDAVREVKERLDVVEVIGGYVRLQRAGRDHKGLCPFHSEKTPSFNVSGEKQMWYCFGCNQGGDVFDFVQKFEDIDFAQALQSLASRAGVTLDDRPAGRRRAHEKTRAREANKLAAQFFHYVLTDLPAGKRGLKYLTGRGVEEETIAAFNVGFAPAGRGDNLLRFLKSKDVSADDAVKAGLAFGGDGRRDLDRFRNRLMIPITDESGEVIAFGGRSMDNTPPKYMNSPGTAIYDKSRVIFGLGVARKTILERGRALMVEGYFDVMMAHQNGISNAVASSGTAVTDEQIKILRRLTSDMVLCFDSDDAGRAATQRTIEMAAKAGMAVKVVELPNAKDPGDFFQKTPELWDEAEGAALPGWEWWIKGLLDEQDLESAEGRARAAATLVPLLNRIPQDTALDIYCQLAAERLRLDPAGLLADVQRYRASGATGRAEVHEPVAASSLMPAVQVPIETPPEEDRLLRLLIANIAAPAIFVEMTASDPAGAEALQDLCGRLIAALEGPDGGSNLERHLDQFNPDERARLARLSLTATPLSDEHELRAALADCVDRIRLKSYESAMAALETRLRDIADGTVEADRDELLMEHRDLARRRTQLKTHLFGSRA